MEVLIKRQGRIIGRVRVYLVRSIIGKFFGLMFSKRKNLLFVFNKESIVGIHNFFVFYTIKLVFLSNKKEVVDVKVLKPFRTYTPRKKARFIIELSTPESIKLNIKEGDVIVWE